MSDKTVRAKYKMILEHEVSLARGISAVLIKARPISVWEIMIPVIFIMNFAKTKQSREIFVQNHLFTKNMALKAALDMAKKGYARQDVMENIEAQTRKTLASVPENLYSEEIRSEQVKEIDLLVDHYCQLFEADGEDYAALVVGAYQTRDRYADFFKRLKAAEQNVMKAARRTLGEEADSQTAGRLEDITDQTRAAEADKFFNTG